MRLTSISINNLRRRKGKTVFLVLGLLVGVATVVALVSFTLAMRADVQDKIDRFGANIIITPKSDELTLSYGGITVSSYRYEVGELAADDVAKIKTIPNKDNIALVAPKLLEVAEISSNKVLVVGVDFPQELKLKAWWDIKGARPSSADDVLLGSKVAAKLGASPDSSLTVAGRQFQVKGVMMETGSQDDSLVYMDLATAQSLFNKTGKISLIEASALCRACPIEKIVAQISDVLPGASVSALQQAMKSREQTVDQLTNFSIGLSVIVLFIGALIVLVTMMSSVNERTREVGIFRAIGFRRRHIMNIILFEALIISLFSGLLGWLAGMGVSTLITPHLAQISVGVEWNPFLAGGALALSLLVGLAASIYPAVHASNLDPAEALRFI